MKVFNSQYLKLPPEIGERSQDLIGLENVNTQSNKRKEVEEYLVNILPSGDVHKIIDEFSNVILVGSKRSRVRPSKSLLKAPSEHESSHHRGSKRMTCAEKRKMGLLRLNKKNKTFQMFVPIHKMWREYVVEALGGINSAHKGINSEVIQNKLKKLELVGCVLKVTRSRCSEYIGTEGIVIQETKNTFTLIDVNNNVKMIPKIHSEFSFIIENCGVSFLGNHSRQRPVDKAKQNFKKHILWL